MKIIEPCCAQRQMKELRNAIMKGGTEEFMGYGDLSLTELLPALLTRYSETELLIAAPSLPDQAAEVIGRWMNRQWSRADGQGKLDVVRHLTLVADLSKDKSPVASGWLNDNPFGGRMTLVDKEQEDTAILLPDLAITGPVNMRYGHQFTARATADAKYIAALWRKYGAASVEKAPEKPEEKKEISKEKPAADAPAGKPVKVESPKQKKEMPGQEAGQQEGTVSADQTMS